MKKLGFYFLALLFLCFILPAMLTKKEIPVNGKEMDKKEETEIEAKQEEKKVEATTKDTTIQLLHQKTGEVENVNLDQYLCHVVSAEMPADYEMEALKAQAIVARTYTLYKAKNKKHENADICDESTCCQAWVSKEDRLARWEESQKESNWQKIEQCIRETNGKIITYNHEPINAFFHSNSGGTTELPVNVWGGSGFPYLQVVETAGEEGYRQYASEVILTNEQLIEKLKTKYQDIQIDFNNPEEIKILEYTDSKRAKTVQFGNHKISGVEARSIFGLKSTNFELTKEANQIKFAVKGYGHGVGMSQTGADTMAKQGSNYEEIIHHFYVGVEIEEM